MLSMPGAPGRMNEAMLCAVAVLPAFRSGARANSPGMSDLVRTLDEGDIDAVAAYLNAAQ